MRVSTNQLFESGYRGIARNQFDFFKLQNQLSTGRRVLTPADDPIGAAQALVLSQSKGVSEQFLKNQGDAKSKLGLLESQLTALGDLLQNVRERVVQAGNTTLSNSDRTAIANELEARFSELMGIANTQDGAGNYLFSGYQGGVRPFAVVAGGAQYYGDEGKRLLQVESSRQMPTNISGVELFQRIPRGNGYFSTATGGNETLSLTIPPTPPISNGINQGTGVIDQGSVSNLANWKAAVSNGYGDLKLVFSTNATTDELEYEIVRPDPFGGSDIILSGPHAYEDGASITLRDDTPPATDFGASIVITGEPVSGDTFTIAPSSDQSMFSTLQETIDLLKAGIGSVANGNSSTEFVNGLAGNLQNIDQALEKVLGTRATVGSYLRELDSLTWTGEDMQLQYEISLSELQDLDYARAITEFFKRQTQLEAVQLAFKQTSQLSLFSIL